MSAAAAARIRARRRDELVADRRAGRLRRRGAGRASRLVAKVDSAAVQDGFDLYLHGFIVADDGHWVVVQQGMNGEARQARRYHWLSEGLQSFVEEPHAAIEGDRPGRHRQPDRPPRRSRRAGGSSICSHARARRDRARSRAKLEGGPRRVARVQPFLPHLVMPAHHDVRAQDVVARRLHGALAAAADRGPADFAELLLVPGRRRAHGARAGAWSPRSCTARPIASAIPRASRSPMAARTAIPIRCRLKVYDQTIDVLKAAVRKAKLGHIEELAAIRAPRRSGAAPRAPCDRALGRRRSSPKSGRARTTMAA